jgi:uncharacterized membrane protein
MTTTTRRGSDWWIPALLILLSLVPAIAGTARLAQLARGADVTPANARFFAQPFPVILHILCVIPYSMVGAFQFSKGVRRRHRSWHRIAGRVLGVLGLVAAASGLWMAHYYPWPEGDGVGVYAERLVFGTAMIASIVLGIDAAARRRDFNAHGAWMIRAYAIGLGAGTQVLTHLPWFIFVGKPGEAARTVLMGAGWVINVIVAEWIIRSNQSRRLYVARDASSTSSVAVSRWGWVRLASANARISTSVREDQAAKGQAARPLARLAPSHQYSWSGDVTPRLTNDERQYGEPGTGAATAK